MPTKSSKIAFGDLETTGDSDDVRTHEILEIGFVVTSPDLVPLDDGIGVVVQAPALEDMRAAGLINPVVIDMHTRNGLLDEVAQSTVDLSTAESMILDYLGRHGVTNTLEFANCNARKFDRAWIAYHLPKVHEYLYHGTIDVSSIRKFTRRWHRSVYTSRPKFVSAHRALGDAFAAAAELQHYQRHLEPVRSVTRPS